MISKPMVTVSGKKVLFKSILNQRITQDLPQEPIEWRRRLDSNSRQVYIDVDFVDFDVDNVERASERLLQLSVADEGKEKEADTRKELNSSSDEKHSNDTNPSDCVQVNIEEEATINAYSSDDDISMRGGSPNPQPASSPDTSTRQMEDASRAFFSKKLLGRPILHTFWADRTDFEGDAPKSIFDEWIGQVQASSCTEWAIVIIEGDSKTQLGAALFKSKLQNSANQANVSSTSIASMTQLNTSSFLDRFKKGLSIIFQSDSSSDRWLTLINQDHPEDSKAQDSYANFIKRFRSIIMASFSKQIELFEEQLRVQREMRIERSWNFFSYFVMQEELAFAFEFLTLFDEALVQYDLLDALFTDHIASLASSTSQAMAREPLFEQWTTFNSWQALCLDLNNKHSLELRQRIVDKKASLLELRNYLFAKQCDLMLMQNQPWKVAASASIFLQNCIIEHEFLNIDIVEGALTCWCFVSALEILQKCECYSCTSTMENYSLHTVDIWNCARRKLLELGMLTHQMPSMSSGPNDQSMTSKLIAGLGPDPHRGVSYQNNEISPQARLADALSGKDRFSKHLIEISELTLGTYKHIGRKRHALLVGRELADFYIADGNFTRAIPFLVELERTLSSEKWDCLREDVEKCISKCDPDYVSKTREPLPTNEAVTNGAAGM